MDAARRREEWTRTARICALLAEPYRDSQKRSEPYTDADFHPDGSAAYREPEPEEKQPEPTTAAEAASRDGVNPRQADELLGTLYGKK